MAYLQSSILNHILFLFFQTCLYVSYLVEISNLWVSKLSRTSDENRLSLLQKWKQGIIFFLYFLGFDILSLRPSALQSLTFKFWPSPQILSVLDKATHRNAVHWLYKAKLWAHECYVQGPTKLTSSMLHQKKKNNLGFFSSSRKRPTRWWTFKQITQLCWT